jgi:PDZ domain
MSDEVTPNEAAPGAEHEAPAQPEATAPAAAAEETQPAIASGGPAPAELGWGAQPAGALPTGTATATMDPPPAPPPQPVAVAPTEPPSERRWTTRQGVLVALLVLLLGLGGGFAIGRASDSGGSSSQSLNSASVRDLLQQLERNGGLQQALRDLFGQLGRNGTGNGNNTFPFNPRNGNGNNNGGNNNGNGNGNGGTNQTPTTSSAFLGVEVAATSNGQGVAVQAVQSGSPAAQAGLQQGDVITAVDGTNVNSTAALGNAVRSHQPGDTVTITYTRNGQSATAKVTLANRSSSTTTPTAPPA